MIQLLILQAEKERCQKLKGTMSQIDNAAVHKISLICYDAPRQALFQQKKKITIQFISW